MNLQEFLVKHWRIFAIPNKSRKLMQLSENIYLSKMNYNRDILIFYTVFLESAAQPPPSTGWLGSARWRPARTSATARRLRQSRARSAAREPMSEHHGMAATNHGEARDGGQLQRNSESGGTRRHSKSFWILCKKTQEKLIIHYQSITEKINRNCIDHIYDFRFAEEFGK